MKNKEKGVRAKKAPMTGPIIQPMFNPTLILLEATARSVEWIKSVYRLQTLNLEP